MEQTETPRAEAEHVDTAALTRATDLARRILVPVAVFLLARVRLWQAARVAGENAMEPSVWARWDSAHYSSIAERGYELFSCARVPGYDPSLWCGNTAWLPGFALLMRTLSAVGVDSDQAGALIAASFALASLILIWNLFLDAKLSAASFLTMLLAAFFPGHVYQHAVFPVSMATFFNLPLHANLWVIQGGSGRSPSL